MLIDAHLHLQDNRLDGVRPQLGELFESENIGQLVVNGTREADWSKVAKCSTSFSQVIPSFGLHPWWLDQRSSHWLDRLEAQLKNYSAAVGEVGLDRWFSKDTIEEQEEVFVEQWNLANKYCLPVSVHCLKAWGRLLDIVRKYPHQGPGFLLHSYGGPAEMIDEWVKLGARFSISGYFAQPRKIGRKEIFKRIPIDRVLIETDAPDMYPPEELRTYNAGNDHNNIPINHPGNLRSVYRFAADWLGCSFEQLETQIESNFNQMFGSLTMGVGPNY
jgi:TatD DNase family protein